MIYKSPLAARIFEMLLQGDVMAKEFPMLLRCGIADTGVTVHSHFLTFLATVGQSLGYAAVAECPIIWADRSKVGDVVADSIWFDKETLTPRVAIEFERFEHGDEPKLRQKVENLTIASLASTDLELSLFIYWVRTGSAPRSMESVVDVYRTGFRRRGCDVPPAVSPLMIVKCVMRPEKGGHNLLFGEFLRDERNERLAIRTF
ncbi:MAG: hypothetical protein ABSE08_14765 [Syntrophobacteraceae bacterium]|jgi:hypothetical protein